MNVKICVLSEDTGICIGKLLEHAQNAVRKAEVTEDGLRTEFPQEYCWLSSIGLLVLCCTLSEISTTRTVNKEVAACPIFL